MDTATSRQVCVTAHRTGLNVFKTRTSLREAICRAYIKGFVKFACGMAMGGDTIFADEVCNLRDSLGEHELFSDMEFFAYVPFEGQELRWAQPDQQKYAELLRAANEVIYTAGRGYQTGKYIIRDKRMVDESEVVIAVYDGRDGGGTKSAMDYALGTGKYVWLIDAHSGVGKWLRPHAFNSHNRSNNSI